MIFPLSILTYLIKRTMKKAEPIAERLQTETATREEDGVKLAPRMGLNIFPDIPTNGP